MENAVWFFRLDISKERMDSRKPLISGRDAALSICFQPFEKVNDHLYLKDLLELSVQSEFSLCPDNI